MNNRTLLNGDCLEKLKELDDNSIDLICTDPPYGYSFMNKEWDKAVVACEQIDRNWIGVEMNPEYCDIIRARIADYEKQMRLL